MTSYPGSVGSWSMGSHGSRRRSPRSAGLLGRLLVACTAALAGCADLLPGLPFPWRTEVFGEHRLVGVLDSPDVPESSGLASSSRRRGVYWTHNDSGPPRVYALLLEPDDAPARVRLLGYVELAGARNRDWEDIASGPGGTFYILDGGDNPPCDRDDKCIYRFTEPPLDGPESFGPVPWERLRFEYPADDDPARPAARPEDRFDAETLLVHPATGDLYIVTKRDTRDHGVARVFKLQAASARWGDAAVNVLRPVHDLTAVLGVSQTVLTTAVGGEIDPTGRRMVLRRYFAAYEFTLPQGAAFEEIFRQTPLEVPLPGELQGEGICYAHDGRSLVTTSEVVRLGPRTCPVFFTPWEVANLRVAVRGDRAAVRWDTRLPVASRLEYRAATAPDETAAAGESAAAGRSVEAPGPNTRHLLGLRDLCPATRYFLRIVSGRWALPRDPERPFPSFVTPG